MPTDFLTNKLEELRAREAELAPVVVEHGRITAAIAALEGIPAAKVPAPARRRSASTNGGSRPAARRGRPKGSGSRGAQALALVKQHPGIAIPDLAKKMGIHQNYLYRVLPGLAEQGLVAKEGRGWHAKEAS
jgi:hypothetical protein